MLYHVDVFFIVGNNCSGFTVGPEIFSGIKAKARKLTHAARASSLVFCANGLGRIFNHNQLVPARDVEDRIHVGAGSIKVHRHDHFRSQSDRRFNLRRIDVAGQRIDVNENRRRSRVQNSRHRRDKGVTNCNHLITRSYACCQQGQMQRTCSGIYSERETRLTVSSEILFKGVDLWAQNELATLHYLCDGAINFGLDARVLRFKVY